MTGNIQRSQRLAPSPVEGRTRSVDARPPIVVVCPRVTIELVGAAVAGEGVGQLPSVECILTASSAGRVLAVASAKDVAQPIFNEEITAARPEAQQRIGTSVSTLAAHGFIAVPSVCIPR